MSVTRIDGRTTISEPGTYELATDIEHGGGTHLSEACIRIESDDVVFDGAGYTIDGFGVSDTSGIFVTECSNVVIRNVTLTEWDYGIWLEHVTEGRVLNSRFDRNGYGLSFEETNRVSVTENTFTGNIIGIAFDSMSNDFLRDNVFESNVGRDVYRNERRD
ncbi:NosD domain-containing protein [Haladaptatus sp. CMSO5]|uniref:NosD domain-containing protein n=1 Tax=Haladaptatus sp. CMSO5 TaxID=3120514 RepID=UPI002FCE567C